MPLTSIPHTAPPAIQVVYDQGKESVNRPVKIGNRRCALRFVPDGHVAGAAVVLDLTLRCPGLRNGEDLLSSAYRWHGLQPFIFPAADMVDGPKNSIGGEVRTMLAPQLGVALKVKVLSAVVSPASSDYGWDHLALSVQLRSSAKVGRH